MDRNTLIAFLLIALVLIITPFYLEQFAPAPQESTTQTIQKETKKEPEERSATPVRPKVQEEPGEQEALAPFTATDITEVPETIINVQNDLFTAVVSSRNGGSFISYSLKKYAMQDTLPVELISNYNKNNLLISVTSLDGDPFVLNNSWQFLGSETNIDASVRTQTLRFSTVLFGRTITKTLSFHPGAYQIDVEVDLSAISDELSQRVFRLSWNGGLPPTEKDLKGDIFYFKAYVYQGGEIDDDTKIKKDEAPLRKMPGETAWVAVRTKYFMSALIPKEPAVGAEVSGKKVDGIPLYNVALKQESNKKQEVTLYFGPLEYRRVKALGVDLEKTMTFGWTIIRPISRMVLALLVYLHKIIPNYGVILILFSIMVKLVVYPLTKKSYLSTQKMQAIQPKVAALKEKYKKDPQKLNKATMDLYKEYGVNPLGGCLPMLLQMPLLIALFQVFRSTIELRGAPFVLWIKDLSAPDTLVVIGGFPINVLPLLMLITMLLQQKMTPTQAPGQQKSMMYVMNFVFLFIFYRLPSGLNLYYTLFNVLTILQQKLLSSQPIITEPVKKNKNKKPHRKK
ncbi:MAG: membrane protein insertase YidC [FCB group bacterium]|nr:membrane protein insertase YidC [FCB group bacterium]